MPVPGGMATKIRNARHGVPGGMQKVLYYGTQGLLPGETEGGEMPDYKAEIAPGDISKIEIMGELLNHPELWERYPELKEYPVEWLPEFSTISGAYDLDNKRFLMNPGLDPEEFRGTALHEIQHAIQDIEDWHYSSHDWLTTEDKARIRKKKPYLSSADVEVADRLGYYNRPGEHQARDVELRSRMTPEELASTPSGMLDFENTDLVSPETLDMAPEDFLKFYGTSMWESMMKALYK